ncbi:MAG: HIT family protein [Eubacteriales bacterium]|nr:HIT family protein [Eubacteriales bacterium]
MNECVFCNIINGNIPSYKIYEDEDFISFLDIAPATKGHVLIVPKKHMENLIDMDDELLKKVLILSKKIVKALKKVYSFNDFNIIQNNGELSGQTVNHFHLHIIPRYGKTELGLWTPHEKDESVNNDYALKIKNELN